MDEPTQRYREIRSLLADLVAAWPWDRPGSSFEAAKVYLDFHCAVCGAKLGMNDLAVVLELEMLRLATVDARSVPHYDPICARCYVVRAGPECRLASGAQAAIVQPVAVGALARTPPIDSGSSAPIDMVVLSQQAGTQIPAFREPPRQRFAYFLHSWQADLIAGAIMLVVLLVVALLIFQPVRHAGVAAPSATPATMSLEHQRAVKQLHAGKEPKLS